jgi:hypothetical protein
VADHAREVKAKHVPTETVHRRDHGRGRPVADGECLNPPKLDFNVDVPYWDVKVDPSIIKDHGDIWNERAEAMMAGIFRMANPMLNRNVKPRATLHRAPDFNRLERR